MLSRSGILANRSPSILYHFRFLIIQSIGSGKRCCKYVLDRRLIQEGVRRLLFGGLFVEDLLKDVRNRFHNLRLDCVSGMSASGAFLECQRDSRHR